MNIIKRRPRFILALIASLICAVIISHPYFQPLSWIEHILISYNIFQWLYVISLLLLAIEARPEKIQRLAKIQDEDTVTVLSIAIISSIITLVGIVCELSTAKEVHGVVKAMHLVLPAITLIGVWILLPTLFSIHYAHLYYLSKSDDQRPMRFPDNPKDPDYFDFLYFSVTISVASQTADVSVNSSLGRKLVMAQSILAFVFNTSVLALGINVAASLLN
jgi:uncharacterized membrane protein